MIVIGAIRPLAHRLDARAQKRLSLDSSTLSSEQGSLRGRELMFECAIEVPPGLAEVTKRCVQVRVPGEGLRVSAENLALGNRVEFIETGASTRFHGNRQRPT